MSYEYFTVHTVDDVFYRFDTVEKQVGIYNLKIEDWVLLSYKADTIREHLDWFFSDGEFHLFSYISGDIVKRHIARMVSAK